MSATRATAELGRLFVQSRALLHEIVHLPSLTLLWKRSRLLNSPQGRLQGDGAARPAAFVLYVQTFGDLVTFNPHIHTLVADGVFLPTGVLPLYRGRFRKGQ
jgi:hypothetical protein